MAVTARGLIGTGSATTAGTTIGVVNTTGATIPAGTFIHITGGWDNINSVTAPTVTCSTVGGAAAAANHATAVGSGVTTTAGSGVWHQCFRVVTTGTIASGATIATLTSNQSAVKRAAHAEGFNNCTATLRGTVTTGTSAAGTPTVTTTGTALVVGDLVIGSISNENSAQATADADGTAGAWPPIVGTVTAGGAANTNVNSGSQYKILTATGTQTFNPTCPAADAVVCVYSVVPVPEPTFTQAAYRLYADGTETGATALAAQDTAYEADVSGGDISLGLRMRLQSAAAAGFASDDYQLQWCPPSTLIDEYPSSNAVAVGTVAATGNTYGQTFLGNGEPLGRARFYLSKTGSPIGTASAVLYAHTGTYGSAGMGTGAVLATSTTTLDIASLTGSEAWYDFDFDGTVTLTNGVPYVIGVTAGGAPLDVSNSVRVANDNTSPTHGGNTTLRLANGTWSAFSSGAIFEVWASSWTNITSGSSTVAGYASANLTDGAATTNRLGAGTGSFSAGKVSEDGLVDDYAASASNYTELLYSITLKQADLSDGDTLTFRVLRNGATTGLTYTAVPTIDIGGGVPTVYGTALVTITPTATVTGVRTVRGTVAITEAVATTVTGVPTTFGTALVSAAATVTAAGARTGTGTAAIAASATVTASGTSGVPAVTVYGTALVSASATTTVTGKRIVRGTIVVSESVAVTVAGTVIAEIVTGTALISANAAVTVVGKRTVRGTVAIGEAVAVTATGTPSVPGTALVSSSAAITAVGKRTVRGVVAVTESATITASGTPSVPATVLLSATATVTAVGRKTVYGTVARTESVTVTALGSTAGQSVGTALVASTATITAVGKRTVSGTAAIASSVAVAVVGRRDVRGTAAITAAATVTASGTVTAEVVTGTALVSSTATVTAAGKRTLFGTALVAASAVVSVSGVGTGVGGGAATITAPLTITAVGKRTVRGTVAITASATATVVGTRTVRGTVLRTQTATITAAGQRYKPGVALVTVSATVTVVGKRTRPGVAQIAATATVTAVGKRTVLGVAVLTAAGTVTVGTATRTVYGTALVGVTVTVTGLVITYYDDTHPHTGSWALTYMATYALEYTGTVERRYTATYDSTAPSGTWDLDHTATWELV